MTSEVSYSCVFKVGGADSKHVARGRKAVCAADTAKVIIRLNNRMTTFDSHQCSLEGKFIQIEMGQTESHVGSTTKRQSMYDCMLSRLQCTSPHSCNELHRW